MPRTRQTLAQHLAPFSKNQLLKTNNDKAWIAEGLLKRGEITLLAGRPKDGKTCLAATLATAVARGADFAGIPTARTNVLYLAAEESPLEWGHAVRPYLSKVCPKRLKIVFHPLAIDRPDHLSILRKVIERHKIGLLVVDPLLAALKHMDLKGFPAARSALLRLRTLCRETSVAALVLHHAHERNERAVGAQGHPILLAIADHAFVLDRCPELGLFTLRSQGLDFQLASLNPGHYVLLSTTDFQKTPRTTPK